MSTPQEIQQRIERTRTELSDDVDRLTDKVSPPRVMGRQVDRVKTRAGSLRDRVMGSADAGGGLRGAGQSVSDATGNAKDALGSAPQAVRAQTEGNPLAVGLVAFGLGMVISSLLPASTAEQQLGAQAKAKAEEFAEPVKQTGQQLAEELKPAAQDAVEQVRSTAQDAARDTTQEAKDAAAGANAPFER